MQKIAFTLSVRNGCKSRLFIGFAIVHKMQPFRTRFKEKHQRKHTIHYKQIMPVKRRFSLWKIALAGINVFRVFPLWVPFKIPWISYDHIFIVSFNKRHFYNIFMQIEYFYKAVHFK